MSADNSNTSQTTNNNTSEGNDQKPDKLAEIQAQLAAMIEQQNALTQTVATAMKPAKRQLEEEPEDNFYDPKKLMAKTSRDAQEIATKLIKEEKARDSMIWELSQEYPEIKNDQKLRNAIIEAQKTLPESMQDTPQGYETAVLRAVSRAGLVPKSKRQAVDDDVTLSPSRSSEPNRRQGKVKLSAETLAVAELMGRDINDPEVIKRLEAAASRDRFDKYR